MTTVLIYSSLSHQRKDLSNFFYHPHLNLIEELVLDVDDLTFLFIGVENTLFVHDLQECDEIRVLSGERSI